MPVLCFGQTNKTKIETKESESPLSTNDNYQLSESGGKLLINPTQYKKRLQFIQDRCRMLEEMFEKQDEEGTLESKYASFYVQMVVSLDSCASKLKHFKVVEK